MQVNQFDLIVVGGGAAGIMAAISAKRIHPQLSVAIVDRTSALGRKILVCGAGRCNITNHNLNTAAETHYYGAPAEFIKAILDQFGYEDIVKFFNDLGIELYVERKTNIGKLFPITNQAQTVTALLNDELQRLNVQVFLNTECRNIVAAGDGFTLDTQTLEHEKPVGEPNQFKANYLIMATGGKTYPALGSNGSGYDLISKLGHSIVQPVPSALPLEGKNPLSQELQGTKMEMEVTSIIEGKKIKTAEEDVMFTQYGLSGPAILNISREISIHFNREHKNNAEVSLNFFPGQTTSQLAKLFEQRWQKRPDQRLEVSMFGLFPNKIPPVLLKIIGLDKDKQVSELTEQEKQRLCINLTDYRIKITGTRGWNEAEFTAGGVQSNEVIPGVLESKLIKSLYFCGETLDVDGDVGGFNLSWAWSSGYVAGQLKSATL
jgi:predicted Rossmann fold flavoprotein